MKSCRAGAWGGPQRAQCFPFASYWVMWSQHVHTLSHNIVFLPPFLFFCYEGCVSREKRSWGCVTEKIISNCASAFTAVEMPLWLGNHQGDLQPPLSAFSLRFKRRTEKHHSPGECSLVTASEIPKLWQTDVVAVHGYVSGYSSACFQLVTRTWSDDENVSKTAFFFLCGCACPNWSQEFRQPAFQIIT